MLYSLILFTLGQILQKCQFSVSGVSNQVVGENPDELSEEISDQNITVETPEE